MDSGTLVKRINSLAIFLLITLCSFFSANLFAEEISTQTGEELIELHRALLDYTVFWSGENPYQTFNETASGETIVDSQTDTVARAFGELAARYHYGIEKLDYDPAPGFNFFCGKGPNPLQVDCFDFNGSLLELWDYWTESVEIGAQGDINKKDLEGEFWRLRRDINTARLKQVIQVISPWILGMDEHRARFIADLNAFNADAGFDHAKILKASCVKTQQTSCEETSFKEYEKQCKNLSQANNAICTWVNEFNAEFFSHRKLQYTKFFSGVFSSAYQDSLLVSDSDYARYVQLYEILSVAGSNATRWLNIDLSDATNARKEAKPVEKAAVQLLKSSSSIEQDSRVDCLGPFGEDGKELDEQVREKTAYTSTYFKDCMGLLKTELSEVEYRTQILAEYSTAKVSFLLAFRSAMKRSVAQLESRFSGVSTVNIEEVSLWSSYVTALTRLSSIGLHVSRINSVTQNRTVCDTEATSPLVQSFPIDCYFASTENPFSAISLHTEPLRYLKVKYSDPAIRDQRLQIGRGPDGNYELIGSAGIRANFLGAPKTLGSVEQYRVYDFGAYAHGLQSSYLFSIDCDVWARKAFAPCSRPASVRLSWNDNSQWLPLDNVDAVNNLIWDLGVSRIFEAYIPELTSSSNSFEPKLIFSLKPTAMRLNIGVEVEIAMLSSDTQSWLQTLNKASQQALSRSVREINALISKGNLNADWINPPDGLVVAAFGIASLDPLRLKVLAFPEGNFHLLSSYEGTIEDKTGNRRPMVAWKAGRPVFPEVLSYALSVEDIPIEPAELSSALSALLFGPDSFLESDADILMLSGLVDELIRQLYEDGNDRLHQVQMAIAQHKYVESNIKILEQTLLDKLKARITSYPIEAADQHKAELQKSLQKQLVQSGIFAGPLPDSSTKLQALIGTSHELHTKLTAELVASLEAILVDYASQTWATNCIGTSQRTRSACGMPNQMRVVIKSLVRKATKIEVSSAELDAMLGDLSRGDFFVELEALRTAYEAAIESKVETLWPTIVTEVGPRVRRWGADIVGNALRDTMEQCELEVNAQACKSISEWINVLAWSHLHNGKASDNYYGILVAFRLGPFRQALRNIFSSYALQLTANGELSSDIQDFDSKVYSAFGDLLGNISLLPKYDLDFGDAIVKKLVRSEFNLLESEAGNLVAVNEQLPLRAGDILLGFDCKSASLPDCRFKLPNSSDLSLFMKNATSDLVIVSRNGRQIALALGYDYEFFYSIAPKIDEFVNTPSHLFTLIPAKSDVLQAEHEYLESASQKLRSAAESVQERALDHALHSLTEIESQLQALCADTVPVFSEYCGNLGELYKALFKFNAHQQIREIVQLNIDKAISRDALIEQCLDVLPDSSIELFHSASLDSCETFANEVTQMIPRSDPKVITTEAIYKVVSRVFDSFGTSLSQSANDERWIAVTRVLFVIDQNKLNSVSAKVNALQAGICVELSSGKIGLPVTGTSDAAHCAGGQTYFDSINTAKEEIIALGAESARPFFESYKQQLRDLETVCLELGTPGFGTDPEEAKVCSSLENIVKNPETFIEELGETAATLAEANAASYALGYLESFGVVKEGDEWCIDLSSIGNHCATDPEDLVRLVANIADQQLKDEIHKRAGKSLEKLTNPLRERLEHDSALFCQELDAFFEKDLTLLGGTIRLESKYKCPSSDFSLSGVLVVDAFSEKNRQIRVDSGLSIDVQKFRDAIEAGREPSADTIEVNWTQLKFTPSLESIIEDELNLSNAYVEFSDVFAIQGGLDIRFVMSPPGFSIQLPGSIRVTKNNFNLDISNAGDIAVANMCREVNRYVTSNRLSPFDGIVVTGSNDRYCADRKFRGFEFSANVDFADPIGTQELGIIVDLDRGISIEAPDFSALAATGVLAALDLDFLKPVPPVYSFDNGITLFLEGTIDTPIGLSLTTGFSISPTQFRFNGPVGLKIPGWYDTGVLSFGNLGLYFDPNESIVRFDGSLTVIPGEAMSDLVVLKGSASFIPREQEIKMESSMVILRVIPLGSSITRLSFKERLFDYKLESGPLLADVVAISGLLRIQDKAPYPFFVANGDGDLFGADIAEMQVRLDRSFAGLFGAKLKIPATRESIDFSVTMQKEFSNPEAQGKIAIDSGLFEFDLDMRADTESVTVGLQAKPPKTSISINLPTFKLLTADFLAGLITDLKLRFEVPSNIDFSNSGGEQSGGDGGPDTQAPIATGGETDDNKQPPNVEGYYTFEPVWKPHRERFKKTKWFGIKIGYEWAYRWVEKFRNSRSAQLSRAIGLNAKKAKDLQIYYAKMTASIEQAQYEVLAEYKENGRIWIFDSETSSEIWRGKFSGGIKEFNGRVVTHQLSGDKSFVIMRFGMENLSIAVKGAAIDGRQHHIPETQGQGDDSAFARYIIRESANEILWKGNLATPIPIGDKDRSYLVSLGNAPNQSYRFVNYNANRPLDIVSYEIQSARPVSSELEFIRSRLDRHEEGLHHVLNTACTYRTFSTFNNPCGHIIATSSQGLFALEPQPRGNTVSSYSVTSRAFAVTSDTNTSSGRVFTRDGVPTAAIFESRSSELDMLFERLLSGLDSDTVLQALSIDLDGQMRAALFADVSGGEQIWSVAGDLDIEGERYKLRRATRDCIDGFWDPQSTIGGAFLAPSKKSLNSNNTDMDTALLISLGFAGAYQGMGFKADPLGLTFDQCGENN